MFNQKRLKKDIEELDQFDPKYIPLDDIKKESSPIFDRIASLQHVVFLQPNDPWMMVDNTIVQKPYDAFHRGIWSAGKPVRLDTPDGLDLMAEIPSPTINP